MGDVNVTTAAGPTQQQAQQQQQQAAAAGNPTAFDEPLLGVTRYTKLRRLGGGSFGVVELARDNQTGLEVAIKCIKPKPSSSHYKYIQAEILNHRKLQHPYVIRFRELFATEHHICIVMEYANRGSLEEHVLKSGAFTEAASRWFFQQLLMGLDYCHRQGVVNRDVKLSNTLVHDLGPQAQGRPPFMIKIADFGYSKACNLSDPKTVVGTYTCMAPEVLQAANIAAYDGAKADIYSCGVLLYSMLFGRLPFPPDPTIKSKGQQRRLLWQKIMQGEWSIPDTVSVKLSDQSIGHVPVQQWVHASCIDLLQRMLATDPQQRISIQEIYAHSWFTPGLAMQQVQPATLGSYLGQDNLAGMQAEQEITALLSTVMQRWQSQETATAAAAVEQHEQDDEDYEAAEAMQAAGMEDSQVVAWFHHTV